MTTRHLLSFNTRVLRIKEYFADHNWRKDSETGAPVSDKQSLGWFVLLEGSRESLSVGTDRPPALDAGTPLKVTLEWEEP